MASAPPSKADWSPDVDDAADVIEYYQDRPVAFFEDIGFTLADSQKEILRAAQEHNRILVMSGNGTGKTAGVIMAEYHYFITQWNALCLTTSGNYDVLRDTAWPFLQTIHKRAQEHLPVPGTIKHSSPRIDVEDWPEWFLRFRSPAYPENLEGRHGRRAMVVIDEADKPDVSETHFSSATSTASSDDDVVIAIANPPENKSNVVYDKWQSDRWHTIEFSSFDSHNVQKDLGELPDGDDRGRIPGVVDLDLVIEDYEAWNGYDWPGADKARQAVQVNDDGLREPREDHPRDLDPRWYRKRLGVMPPTGQGVLRPFYERHVDDAVERYKAQTAQGTRPSKVRADYVEQLGTDIARSGGDRTIAIARHPTGLLQAVVERRVNDHEENHDILSDADDRLDRRGPWVIDAVGEGSGVADRLRAQRANVKRFDAGEDAKADGRYYNRKAEVYVALGNRLKNDALVVPNSELERELRKAARVLKLTERSLRGGTTLQVKGKDALKKSEHLGRSPDYLDAAAMACYDAYQSNFSVPDVAGVVE